MYPVLGSQPGQPRAIDPLLHGRYLLPMQEQACRERVEVAAGLPVEAVRHEGEGLGVGVHGRRIGSGRLTSRYTSELTPPHQRSASFRPARWLRNPGRFRCMARNGLNSFFRNNQGRPGVL